MTEPTAAAVEALTCGVMTVKDGSVVATAPEVQDWLITFSRA